MKRLAVALDFIDRISLWSGKAVSYLLFSLIGVLVYAVTARYVFNSPVLWGDEISRFLFGTVGLLAGAHCLYRGAHVRMDVVYNRLSIRGKAIVDVLTASLFFYFVIVLLWQGGQFALRSILTLQCTDSVWGPPEYPIKTIIPVAAFLLILQGAAKFIRDLVLAIRGRPLL